MIVAKHIIGILACTLLWYAVDYKRSEVDELRFGSKDWCIVCFMLVTSIYVIDNLDKWFEQ